MSEQKHALIFGVTSELGQYCAQAWQKEGWRVTGTSRNKESDLKSLEGVLIHQVDFSQSADVERWVSEMDECPDLVVFAPAEYSNEDPSEMSLADFSRIFSVNALSPFWLSLQLLKKKAASRFACFIFIGSCAMYNADRGSAVYGASKAALKVLSAGVADFCAGQNAAAADLILGHLKNQWKLDQIAALAEKYQVSIEEVRLRYLTKSEPNIKLDHFIEFSACSRAIQYIYETGSSANGMALRLDGGAAGSFN